MAAGTAFCVFRDGAAHSVGGGLGQWVGQFLKFGGLALLEGAAVGAAVAFGLVRFPPRPEDEPPDNRDQTA